MTKVQTNLVNELSNSSHAYRVLFVKNGFVFMTSPVKEPNSLIRISHDGAIKELAEE